MIEFVFIQIHKLTHGDHLKMYICMNAFIYVCMYVFMYILAERSKHCQFSISICDGTSLCLDLLFLKKDAENVLVV